MNQQFSFTTQLNTMRDLERMNDDCTVSKQELYLRAVEYLSDYFILEEKYKASILGFEDCILFDNDYVVRLEIEHNKLQKTFTELENTQSVNRNNFHFLPREAPLLIPKLSLATLRPLPLPPLDPKRTPRLQASILDVALCPSHG